MSSANAAFKAIGKGLKLNTRLLRIVLFAPTNSVTRVTGYLNIAYFDVTNMCQLHPLRWLRRVIIYGVARANVMLVKFYFLHSFYTQSSQIYYR